MRSNLHVLRRYECAANCLCLQLVITWVSSLLSSAWAGPLDSLPVVEAASTTYPCTISVVIEKADVPTGSKMILLIPYAANTLYGIQSEFISPTYAGNKYHSFTDITALYIAKVLRESGLVMFSRVEESPPRRKSYDLQLGLVFHKMAYVEHKIQPIFPPIPVSRSLRAEYDWSLTNIQTRDRIASGQVRFKTSCRYDDIPIALARASMEVIDEIARVLQDYVCDAPVTDLESGIRSSKELKPSPSSPKEIRLPRLAP